MQDADKAKSAREVAALWSSTRWYAQGDSQNALREERMFSSEAMKREDDILFRYNSGGTGRSTSIDRIVPWRANIWS